MACDRLAKCIFFNDQMQRMPSVSELLKNQYCRGAFDDCARFRVASRLGAAAVPEDMFPTDDKRAEVLLYSAR